MSGMLYLVPTPIGNLGDISPRMAEGDVPQVDFIAAEDTRVSVKLLNHLGIKKPMVSYYRHNTSTSGPAILERLLAGESCALVTDAGTPAISDPGEELVALCAQAGVEAKRVFPHNFRHLFARAFYALEKDIAKLADLLGHASVETTRIYIMESGAEHTRQVERLGLVL